MQPLCLRFAFTTWTFAWLLFAVTAFRPLAAQDAAPADLFHFNGLGKISPRIVTLIEKVGGRVDWSSNPNNLIAYDRFDPASKHFQVWVMNPDGSSPRTVTSLNSTLAGDNTGNPAWHPSGNYLVVQAADMAEPVWASLKTDLYQRMTGPGSGLNNDLWITSIDASHAAALTHLNVGEGVLEPHFSHGGDVLLWSQLVTAKPQKWVMHTAKFVVGSDGPHMTELRTFDPFGNAIYVAHDFSTDDKQVLFSTIKTPGDFKHVAIARMDLATGKARYLTDAGAEESNDLAHYSPDGSKILWASSRGIEQNPDRKIFRSDVWMMHADGSDHRRLTFFNDSGAPEFRREAYNIVSDLSWSPDGKSFLASLLIRTKGELAEDFTGSIFRVTLP